ncbi:tetratricopeptide repeat protein [bacterium]|nr:tetratricopeptide repeat protein [bacterium]MCI0602746.1 tetratricopeptide repeat protein [bacterium]
MSKGPAPFDQGLFLMHLHKGKEYFDQDQLEKAREELEAAYHLRPHDEKVLNMLGMTYYKLEMLPEAEDMYVTLAANNPDIYALQSNLGLIQLKLNRLQQARDSLNRALELQPSNSKAHFYMGLLYEKQGLWEDALYHFEQANAEKMVAKMQVRLDEQQTKSALILPFEIVEILEPEVTAAAEQDLASFVQDEIQSQAKEVYAEEITGRIKAPDLAEAMLQIHEEEMLAPQERVFEMHVEAPAEDVQKTANLEPLLGPPTPQEEELPQEKSSGQIAEQREEEIQEVQPWEKTHPTLFPEQLGTEPEAVIHTETTVLISSPIDDPFLLSDDIAADISTFLAQSRSEENPEEDVFYREPVLPEFAIVTTAEPAEPDIPVEEAPQEYRIPTPEEVENEISETASEESVTETPVGGQAKLIAEAVQRLMHQSGEESVEELSEEALDTERPAILEREEEEDLEVNFAVTESEDEETEIQQGFLQPSPLTPEIEEEKLEQTQDMAYNIEAQPEWSMPEVELPSIESVEPTPEEAPANEEAPVQEEAAVQEEAIAENQPEPMLQEQEEEGAAAASVPEPARPQEKLVTQEMPYPANLDQFSRDRLYIQPFLGSDRFLLIDPHLLEIIISEKLICRIGTISSYTGNLQFSPWDDEEKKQMPLIIVSGSGIVFLADRRKEILMISLNNEVIFVEANHFLVAQSSLKVEPQILRHEGTGVTFSILRISGRGTLALTCQTKPLTVNVHEELPANIPAQAVIAWSGKLLSEVLDDEDLKKILMSEADHMFLRFRGAGDVVVEQGGLWGDRRAIRK